MYTVDKDYDGEDYEMQPKIGRCMFHIGEGKFIMGRIYPQGKDGEKEAYKQWRNIFQKIISECLDIPNYWKTEYDRYDKLNNIESTGTHYKDYECDYCDIAGWSWHKPFADARPSETKIRIGHYPICPSCGCEHNVDDNIECEDCNSNMRCEHCGCAIGRNDDYLTDEGGDYNYCCEECANEDGYYSAEDGYCGTVYYRSNLYYEESTDTYWRYDDDSVYVGDMWYHNLSAAEDDGWEYYDIDGKWYREDDFENDALTGERFPYWSDTSKYFEHNDNYFVDEDNMNTFIAESEVA